MVFTVRLFIVIALILISMLLPSQLGCTQTPVTHQFNGVESEEYPQADAEWEMVKNAVEAMFAEADPPVTNPYHDRRIDWENSATEPEKMTHNMTGEYASDEYPLLAIIDPGSEIMPVSHYLEITRTEFTYWIDSRGYVHLAE
ncbi:MAG: hypothetical protein R6U37_00600 [Dehalococcoidia bacterium]